MTAGVRQRSRRILRPARWLALGPQGPKFRFGFRSPDVRAGELRRILPFRRSWPAIGVLAAVFAVFCVPLFVVGGQLVPGGGGDLFSLVLTLFNLFWLLGWSIGVAALGLVLAVLLLGREVLLVAPGCLTVRLEVFGAGVGGEFLATGMHNLRAAGADAADGTGWRGAHLAFDYLGVPVDFGSDIVEPEASELLARVRAVLGVAVPDGPPPRIADTPDTAAHDDTPGRAAPSRGSLSLRSPSTLALIAANLPPLAGVALFGWSMGEIMLLYWAESAIVGAFNLLKLAVIGRWTVLFLGPVFVGHYGGFMAVHLLFIYAFFMQDPRAAGDIATATVLSDLVRLWPALAALVASHALSYRANYLGHAEYAGRSASQQMVEPYKRIVVMHVTIIFGGFLALGLGSPLPALSLLVVLKIVVDTRAHLREHGAARPPAHD